MSDKERVKQTPQTLVEGRCYRSRKPEGGVRHIRDIEHRNGMNIATGLACNDTDAPGTFPALFYGPLDIVASWCGEEVPCRHRDWGKD